MYFIADNAAICSEQYVGCDAFTNLSSVEEGGETVEYYSELRACLTSDMADNDESDMTASTFFTWEGSDNEGYQLQTWYLLESNISSGTTITYSESGVDPDESPEYAPCVMWDVAEEYEVVCVDASEGAAAQLAADDDCNEHDDIFENPDCREFFDEEGNIHYRLYSETISVDDECTPYRKDESTETDCLASGGFWTDQGFCRYFGLPDESTECPSSAAGCREYTGGSGRNASTVLNETFEDGTYEDFVAYQPSGVAELSISNESVATDGHSLRLYASGGEAGFETVQIYVDPADTTYACETEDGCELTDTDEACTAEEGDVSCGTLVDSLVAGKTFMLDFWAKGDGELEVQFVNEGGDGDWFNMVDADGDGLDTTIELGGTWELYSLGPFDSETDDLFDENAVLRIFVSAEGELYIDNLTLRQTEENVTVIKDSWVVPSTCDTAPSGTESDQYYLGCEAYSDQNGNDANLYQFSELCSEDVVGCAAFYNTYNSESEYTQIFNARCAYDDDYDLSTENEVSETTTCTIEGEDLCTITVGSTYCTFDAERAYADPLPYEIDSMTGTGFGIIYGPETVVVPGDQPVYIVADSSYECSSQFMGCQEFGTPTFNQDQSEVEGFESVYLMNLPSEYEDTLCADEALFCEEWSSTQDGNFYFKDPLDKTCDYESSVTIDGQDYFGWFRTDTTEPCYYDDDDGDEEWDVGTEDAYLIAGEELGVWRNGDEGEYEGWVSNCPTSHDLCTEFIDVVDTGGGLNEDGYSYYFVNDELLDEDTLSDTQRCEGLVSQKFGCALFNNTTDSDLQYNAGASYVASMHADAFFDNEKNSLQDPINCEVSEGGYVEISQSEAAKVGVSVDAYGNYVVDLCSRRCMYTLEDDDDEIDTLSADSHHSYNSFLERSCYVDDDCPVLESVLGETVEGTCYETTFEQYYLQNDTNEIIKVNRDRACASWLACESSRTSWDQVTSTYQTICDSINLCTEGSSLGDVSTCTNWDETEPEILTDVKYSMRDVNWTGYEFSGYSIPNQLPVEFYDQFNINPSKVCLDSDGEAETNNLGYEKSCSDDTDCELVDIGADCTDDHACSSHGYGDCDIGSGLCYKQCDTYETDYRLVYNAGPCDSSEDGGVGEGGECYVGFCSDTGDVCGGDADCDDGDCVVGYCQITGTLGFDEGQDSCTTSDDCAGITSPSGYPTEVCDTVQQICVNHLIEDAANACVDTDSCFHPDADCVAVSTSTVGSCFNDRCLTDIVDRNDDDIADALDEDVAETEQCRGYPEIDSPFPYEVVEEWSSMTNAAVPEEWSEDDEVDGVPDDPFALETHTTDGGTVYPWSQPYAFVPGYQDSIICSPNEEGGVDDDCMCSYDKVGYGQGATSRYYDPGAGYPDVMKGVCSYGSYAGWPCDEDSDCTTNTEASEGLCQRVTSVDTMYGWMGYCLERDTSIQLYGSAETQDRACLTWLPVDQLSGATDLYGKYTEAGYELENTYYCADLEAAYDIHTTSSYGCAESHDSCDENGGWDEWVEGDLVDDDGGCIGSVTCPNGFFAVMTGCGQLSHDEERDGERANSQEDDDDVFCDEIAGDADCPFFCVPKGSVKTETDDIEGFEFAEGEVCYPPGEGVVAGSPFADYNRPSNYSWTYTELEDAGYRNVGYEDGQEFTIYLVEDIQYGMSADISWLDVYESYDDCAVRGVVENVEEYYFPYENFEDVPLSAYGNHGFRNLGDFYRAYPVCETVVQVASENQEEVGEYNTAWTDRLMGAGYTIQPISDEWFAFETEGEVSPFGAAISFEELEDLDDPYPHQVVNCNYQGFVADDLNTLGWYNGYLEFMPPLADLSCYDLSEVILGAEDYDVSSEEGEHARSWMNFWDSSGSEDVLFHYDQGWDEYCANEDCSCFRSQEFEDCNDGIECDSGTYLCNGGANEGQDCTGEDADGNAAPDDSMCTVHTCEVSGSETHDTGSSDYTFPTYHCGFGTSDYAIGTEEYESADDNPAVTRLKQVFAKSYDVWLFEDGYEDLASTMEDDSVWPEHGSWCSIADSECGLSEASRLDDWIWDVTAEGDGYSSPEAPVVIGVGDCVGTDCFEEDDGYITVNNVLGGAIVGEEQKQVNVSFYMAADKNQMPIRQVIVDWGDDFVGIDDVGNDVWPTGSQSGSTSHNNFYKNHRGMNDNGDLYCDDGDEWGMTGDSCSASYVLFTKNYTCSDLRLEALENRQCEVDEETGRLINSPCTGTAEGVISGGDNACVFQPRVHVRDNWGWCAGFCDAGDDDTDECYDEECSYEYCPGVNGACPDYFDDSVLSNPWVNYSGYIIVDP